MPNDFIPSKDLDFQSWLANFVAVANANLVDLGLVAADINPVSTARNALNTALTDVTAKEAAFHTAVEAKDQKRDDAEAKVRIVVRKIQANPAVTAALKVNLGITVADAINTSSEPVAPVELTAKGLDSGTNTLNWKKGDNRAGTQYIIEALTEGTTEWKQVDVVTTTRYKHIGQKPGVRITYRIRARRRGMAGEPSNEATVY